MSTRAYGLAAIAALVGSIAVTHAAGSGQAIGWKRLVAVPAIGSWDWRCDRSGRFASRLVVAAGTGTTDVRVVSGQRSRRARLTPGQKLTTSLAAVKKQKWLAVQASKPETISASVTIASSARRQATATCRGRRRSSSTPPAIALADRSPRVTSRL